MKKIEIRKTGPVDELGFLRDPGEAAHAALPVRWERLARMIFSPAGPASWPRR